MADALLSCKPRDFWAELQRVNRSGKSQVSVPSVDGIPSGPAISSHLASKLHRTLNSHDSSPAESILNSVSAHLSSDDLASVEFSSECVFDALRHLKPIKSDGSAFCLIT